MIDKTVAKTFRFSVGLYSLLASESERLKTSEADVVRLSLRNYFDDRQKDDQLMVLEQRIIQRLDAQSSQIVSMLQQVLALAQPHDGDNHA
ncbi:hypothetical protein BCM14_0100 [Jezberella montanilacus]|uniref:Uncharacterized protein n=1 Tax=Jezberella montanilacus TaxID=323426 RepID=A0A2T0XQ59_9BURK|nr:hypothetical protein [Jezberella montanilacus]PRZ01080.1 hypothetical protein BCM14_0100 [Jezberella montanilacus]